MLLNVLKYMPKIEFYKIFSYIFGNLQYGYNRSDTICIPEAKYSVFTI